MTDRSLTIALVVLSLCCCLALSGSLLTHRRSGWVFPFSWLLVCLAVAVSIVSRASGRAELDPWTWWLALLALLLRGLPSAPPPTESSHAADSPVLPVKESIS